MRELSCEYLQENYINQGKNRYQISAETGVDPQRIGIMLQQYGIRRHHVSRHGLWQHPLNVVWQGMKERCNNPNAHNYKWYGDDGISVCDEWKDFIPFYEWAISNGWHKGLTIDRIDGTKGYSPDNCRLVDFKSQCRNRRTNVYITVDGETHMQCEWEELLGFPKKSIAKWKHRHDMNYVINRIREAREN